MDSGERGVSTITLLHHFCNILKGLGAASGTRLGSAEVKQRNLLAVWFEPGSIWESRGTTPDRCRGGIGMKIKGNPIFDRKILLG